MNSAAIRGLCLAKEVVDMIIAKEGAVCGAQPIVSNNSSKLSLNLPKSEKISSQNGLKSSIKKK